MVLAAAPKQSMVWGFCAPGASVDVALDGGASIPATIGPDQATGLLTTWRVKLPAMQASFQNHSITATSGGKTQALSNVLFGEVWICSGQSNMQYPIGSPTCWNASNINCTDNTKGHNTAQCGFGCTQDAGKTITDMAHYDDGMRLFNVAGGSSTSAQPEMRGGAWQTPSAVGGGFSAACWFYGLLSVACCLLGRRKALY
jgi:sialate O-acetylesterase